jgi:hypothetical protein
LEPRNEEGSKTQMLEEEGRKYEQGGSQGTGTKENNASLKGSV